MRPAKSMRGWNAASGSGATRSGIAAMLKDPDAKAGLQAVAPNVRDADAAPATRSDLAQQKAHTLGAWGEAASAAV